MKVKTLKRASWFRGIEAKLSGVLVLLISLVFLIFMVFNFYSTKNEMDKELNTLADMISARLAKNLVAPIWNLDKDQTSEIILSEMMEKQIFAVLVREGDGKTILAGHQRDDQWKITGAEKDVVGDHLFRNVEIKKEESKLGSLEVYFTNKFMKQQLTQSIVRMLITVVVINLVLILSIYFSMKIILIRPITHVIKGLGEGADQVAIASQQVSSSSQYLAEGASEQAASIEETSSALEEMSSMTKQNADNASQADSLMKTTCQIVVSANESMSSLTRSMEEISKASEETSKIIKTIDEIAFQTNLLALNAAVEAARAGEAGAGFAVVADEVRNLAVRAADAAKNTAQLIEGTVKKINEGSKQVDSADTAFNEVTQSSEKVGSLVAEIAAASKEQAQGIERISEAVNEMDKVVQRNAASAEESASASEEMSAQAEHMKGFIKDLVNLVGGKSMEVDHQLSPERRGSRKPPETRPLALRRKTKEQRMASVKGRKEVSPEEVIPMEEGESDPKGNSSF